MAAIPELKSRPSSAFSRAHNFANSDKVTFDPTVTDTIENDEISFSSPHPFLTGQRVTYDAGVSGTRNNFV